MEKIIEVKNLHKEFKTFSSRSGVKGAFRDLFNRNYKIKKAVNQISFSVNKGEMMAYIGENGAGKSTTIKMLTGILTPSSGEVTVNGYHPQKNREQFVRSIGVVFGQRSQLWWDIAVQESFRLLKKVYKVSDEQYEQHMGYIIKTLDLEPLLDQPVRKLSLGQRMRCELAAALIHNPPLLFLDEPTIGLDVLVKLKIREFLKELNQKYGTTILLTTHDISDIEALCDRVVMLDEGKIIYDGTLESLKGQWGEEKEIQFQFSSNVTQSDLISLIGMSTVQWKKEEGENVWKVTLPNDETLISMVIGKVVQHHSVKDIKMLEISTEEIIRNIYQEGIQHG
jgi:ABC-2 type transport system ATP-binding protein